jgi:hypothetical protein
MADVRESFTTLEGSSQEGLALRAVQQGDAVTAKNGSLGFAFMDGSGNAKAAPIKVIGNAPGDAVPVLGFRDSSANLTAPQLDASGRLPVTFDAGTELYDRGLASGSLTNVDVATIVLTATEVYKGIEVVASCFRDAIFEVVQVDDATTTILADILCGPGDYSQLVTISNMIITAGASGTQELKVRAKNLNALSDFRATIATVELP